MKKILFLVGPDKSGKTYLQDKLTQNYPSEYVKIISSTTRDMREGEADGVDYNFHTVDQFKRLNESGKLLQFVKYGDNFYFTKLSDYKKEDKIGVFVCTPEGINDTLNALKKSRINVDAEVYFFAVTDDLLKSRGLDERTNRGDIRKKFYESYSAGEFNKAEILNIKFIQDHEVDHLLHEKVRAISSENYDLQTKPSDMVLGALSRENPRYTLDRGNQGKFIKWAVVQEDIKAFEDFYLKDLQSLKKVA